MTESERRYLAADLVDEIQIYLQKWKGENWKATWCQFENIYLQGQVYMAMKAEVITFDSYLELSEALDISNWIEELKNKEVTDNE